MALNFDLPSDHEQAEASRPVVSKTMTLEAVKATLHAKYSQAFNEMVEAAEAHEIVDHATEVMAIEMAGQADRLFKSMDGERKVAIQEPKAFIDGVNGLARVYSEQAKKIETDLKTKIGHYQYKKEIDRREREKIAREKEEQRLKQLAAEAEEKGVELIDIPPAEIVEKKETTTRTESGASAHIRMEWKMTKIVDFSKVPDKYKEINMKAVNAAIKAGIHEIDGLKIEETATPVLRA